MIELLAPAGNFKKLKTAFHFGADAAYFAGQEFGLRAYAGNFSEEELFQAVVYAHEREKKAYITANIFPYNADFGAIKAYFEILKAAKVDAVLVSDLGTLKLAKAAGLNIHISTQANVTNSEAAKVYAELGAERIVLARETSLKDICKTTADLKGIVETEVFVHGAMCMAYSGRCMLSTYLNGRDSNRGECVQACRWEYEVNEVTRPEKPLTVTEDARGTYIFNSKDLCAMPILKDIVLSGVSSLKIEGRMKSEYYIATVVSAYRKALNQVLAGKVVSDGLYDDLLKVNHREYTTGFYLGEAEICPNTSKPFNSYDFAAEVVGYDNARGLLEIEQRNRFFEGDSLEIVSPIKDGTICAQKIYDTNGNRVPDARFVQQRLFVETDMILQPMDVLRVKRGVLNAK